MQYLVHGDETSAVMSQTASKFLHNLLLVLYYPSLSLLPIFFTSHTKFLNTETDALSMTLKKPACVARLAAEVGAMGLARRRPQCALLHASILPVACQLVKRYWSEISL
jgi:hypothetical protein